MRTTINVDDQLLKQAKAQAAACGVTLGQLIEDVLRASLIRHETLEKRGRAQEGVSAQEGVRSFLLP
jgi:hypothetical protein